MKQILSLLHKDKMDIWRFVSVEEEGITRNQEREMHQSIACKLSKNSLAGTGNDPVAKVTSSHTLFCSPEVDLIEGDRIIVTQINERKVVLTVGEIFPYTSHLEADVKRSDPI